jgi:hypothetical protein
MTDTLDVIEAIRGTLRDAFKQASTDQDKQKIKDKLSDLADLQEQVILQEFLTAAQEMKALSDLLSKVIQDLQGIISNFFINNLSDIANRNGLATNPAGLAPATAPADRGGAGTAAGGGIDCAKDCSKLVDSIVAAGVKFVGRYYRTSRSKYAPLTADEANILSRSGLNVVALWESTSDQPGHFAYTSGVDEGTAAYRQALITGQTRNTPIYFAVDFDASSSDLAGPILDYFRGVADGFNTISKNAPAFKIGVYGSGLVCSWLKSHGMVSYCWLAMSTKWNGYDRFTGWNIKQGPALSALTFDHDSDDARSDYGGFRVGP